jgi:hypothetical protein
VKLSKLFLLILFWFGAALGAVVIPMACTNTSQYFQPTRPDVPVVPSATATNQFGFTSTPTFTLQPTLTATNTPSPAPAMVSPSTIYSPNVPSAIAVFGSPVSVYVAGGDGKLSIYSGGSLVTSFNQYNSTTMSSLSGVAVDVPHGVYYVLDEVNNAVYEFNLTTNAALNTWNNWGSGQTFLNPGGITVDSVGNVYVADTGHDQIDVFSTSGTSSLQQWGTVGQGDGQFDNPSSVAVTINGGVTTVYVADASNELIQVFNFTGTYQSQFSTVAGSDIFDITLDGSGDIFAADYSNPTAPLVEEYNSSGILIHQWDGPGGAFFGPDGVAWLGSLLYVADYDNNAIYTLTP